MARAVRLRRIHPDSADVAVEDVIAGLDLARDAPADRPYVALNMIATVDGRAAVRGGTRAIASSLDRAMLVQLRTQADAVMVGAGTLRSEPYGRLVRNPALRDKRRREGLEPDPLACIVSGRLDLPRDLPLLADRHSRVVIATGSTETLQPAGASVEYLRGERDRLDLARVLRALRGEHGVRSLLCEGGPRLNAHLFAGGLVDELFLTLAATVAGGDEGPAIVARAPFEELVGLELRWVLEGGGELFLRYRVRP